jgi:hypothetical protein
MIVHLADRLAGGLSENARHNRMDKTGKARADKLGTDGNGPDTVSRPAHAKRARMFAEQAVSQSPAIFGPLLRRHSSVLG